MTEELLSGSGHYMKNETEKLNKFKLAVFSEAQQQAQSIISQAEAEQKTRLTQAREETHNELLNIIGTLEKETEAKKVREVSSRRLEAQRNILIHRNEMMTAADDDSPPIGRPPSMTPARPYFRTYSQPTM